MATLQLARHNLHIQLAGDKHRKTCSAPPTSPGASSWAHTCYTLSLCVERTEDVNGNRKQMHLASRAQSCTTDSFMFSESVYFLNAPPPHHHLEESVLQKPTTSPTPPSPTTWKVVEWAQGGISWELLQALTTLLPAKKAVIMPKSQSMPSAGQYGSLQTQQPASSAQRDTWLPNTAHISRQPYSAGQMQSHVTDAELMVNG